MNIIARVINNFEPNSEKEIKLKKGDLVRIHNINYETGWAKGEIVDLNTTSINIPVKKPPFYGSFPLCFVKLLRHTESIEIKKPSEIGHVKEKSFDVSLNQKARERRSSIQQMDSIAVKSKIIRLIRRCKRRNDSSISLEFFRMIYIPEEIYEMLSGFTTISFSHNELYFINIKALSKCNNSIVHLSLDNNKLTEINNFAALENLKILSASKNCITTFPEELCELKSLTVLNLSMNRITTLPNTMSKLQSLTILKLSSNLFSSIPKVIFELVNLEYLDMRHNNIVSIPESIRFLQELKSLLLSDNLLTSVPKEICFLTNLESLRLHNNKITTIPNEIICLWGKLKELMLWRNNFSEELQFMMNSKIDDLFEKIRFNIRVMFEKQVEKWNEDTGDLFNSRNIYSSEHLRVINTSISDDILKILYNEEIREEFGQFIKKRMIQWSIYYHFWLDVFNWTKLSPEERTLPAFHIYVLYLKNNILKLPSEVLLELHYRFLQAQTRWKPRSGDEPLIIEELTKTSLFKYPERYAVLELDNNCLPAFLSWKGLNSKTITYLSKKENDIRLWLQNVLRDGVFRHSLNLLDIISDGVILLRAYNAIILTKKYEKIVIPKSNHKSIWKTSKKNINTFLNALYSKGMTKDNLFTYKDVKKKREKEVIYGIYNFILFTLTHDDFMKIRFEEFGYMDSE